MMINSRIEIKQQEHYWESHLFLDDMETKLARFNNKAECLKAIIKYRGKTNIPIVIF